MISPPKSQLSVIPIVSHILSILSPYSLNLMYIGPCIIVIVEELETNLMSQFISFTSSVPNMFRTLISPSSGAYVFSIVSSHWLCVFVSMCVGSFSVASLGWYLCSRLKNWCVETTASACHTDTTPTQPHRNSNTHRKKNKQPMW